MNVKQFDQRVKEIARFYKRGCEICHEHLAEDVIWIPGGQDENEKSIPGAYMHRSCYEMEVM